MISILRYNHEYPNPHNPNTIGHLVFEMSHDKCGTGNFSFEAEDIPEIKRLEKKRGVVLINDVRCFKGFLVRSFVITDNGGGVGEFEFFDIVNRTDLL